MASFKTKVKLSTVKDGGKFKLNNRSNSPAYSVQKKTSREVIFTGVLSGRTFSRKPGHHVFVNQ